MQRRDVWQDGIAVSLSYHAPRDEYIVVISAERVVTQLGFVWQHRRAMNGALKSEVWRLVALSPRSLLRMLGAPFAEVVVAPHVFLYSKGNRRGHDRAR